VRFLFALGEGGGIMFHDFSGVRYFRQGLVDIVSYGLQNDPEGNS